MENQEYQQEASKTIPEDVVYNNKNFNVERLKIINALLGLSGEVGEVTDLVKKAYFQGHTLDKQDLCKEIGDVFWYLNLLCQALDISFSQVMETNIIKLRKRYGEHFEANKSINREEYRK